MTRDDVIEKMARAHDQEDAAQMGEPSPWTDEGDGFEEFRANRLTAMSEALTALEQSIPGLGGVIEGTHAIIKLPDGFSEETNRLLIDTISRGMGAMEIKHVDPDAMLSAAEEKGK